MLTRKGGVGKTTITTLLGMALADARDDRIIAIDANPDRGTLAERVDRQTRETVRDVVAKASSIGGYTDFSGFVSRDETRLDILASDTDPTLSEAFDDNDYNVVAGLAARYYSIVLTDCGTGIVHSVMRATLQRADSIVIVSGGSVDEARLASETLTWLEANGYGELVRNAIVAINLATQGTHLVKVDEIEAHFQSRVREIVRIPYDPQLAADPSCTGTNCVPSRSTRRANSPPSWWKACPSTAGTDRSTIARTPHSPFGDPVLKTVSAPVEQIDDRVRGLVADLSTASDSRSCRRRGVPDRRNVRAFSYNVEARSDTS